MTERAAHRPPDLAILALLALLAACGGAESGSPEGAAPAEAPVSYEAGDYHCSMVQEAGTDPAARVTYRSCYEFRDLPADEVGLRMEHCVSDAAFSAGSWDKGPCPAEGRATSCIDPRVLRAFSSAFHYYPVDGRGYTADAAKDHCERMLSGTFVTAAADE